MGSFAINSFGEIFAGVLGRGIFRSTDNGDNWNPTGLTAPNISSIAIDSSGKIYVASGGVFCSTDNGDSWSEINSGLTYTYVSSLVISDEYIFAGVIYGGVFRRMNSITSVGDKKSISSSSFLLAQNHPNPFNSNTIIKYSVPQTAKVQIKVYDILGKEVAILVNEIKQTGEYEVEFNANKLTSGIYFYRIQAASFINTRKMILLK